MLCLRSSSRKRKASSVLPLAPACACASYRLGFPPKKRHLVGRVLRSSWKAKKAATETERQDMVDWQ